MIQREIIEDAQKFMAINNRKPIIIVGKETFEEITKSVTNIDIKNENDFRQDGYVMPIFGFQCQIGDFDVGYEFM